MSKVTVLLPAFNEGTRIEKTLNAVKSIKCVDEIIVIDDGSSDNTFEKAETFEGVKAFKMVKNSGKGEALNFGIEKATGDIIVFLDSDLGETAGEAEKIILPVINKECDVTIAKFPKAKKKGGFGFVKRLSRGAVKKLGGQDIESVLSGQRAFKKEVLQRIGKVDSGYGVELGMTIDILKNGYTILEVPVNMTHAETGRDLKGFIHRGKQFWHILKVAVKKSFER